MQPFCRRCMHNGGPFRWAFVKYERVGNYHDTSYIKIQNLCAYHITWCKPTKQHWERQTIYLPKLRWDGLEINIKIVLE